MIGTVYTFLISNITESSAVSGGAPMYDGGSAVLAKGVCWSTSANPSINHSTTTDGIGSEAFVSYISGLEVNTTYYLRAYVTNEAGTGYGEIRSFRTVEDLSQVVFNPVQNYGQITDIEGNQYKTIQIGSQVWMAENLRTTKLKDGTVINYFSSDGSWIASDEPYYCLNHVYESYKYTAGACYNWYTIETGKLCPESWHVPSLPEWRTLTDFLGGDSLAGAGMKETGTIHWESPNAGANNESGFTALPAGYPDEDGFQSIRKKSIWWSTTEDYNCCAISVILSNKKTGIYFSNAGKSFGESVRCIKDQMQSTSSAE
jgi:uncharacterized protein (TIGR02145 family)